MTLTTRVWIKDRIDARDVFFKCRELVGATDQHRYRDKSDNWNPGIRIFQNNLCQGLPALVDVRYRPNGPLCSVPDELCGRSSWLEVSFDTAYSYGDDRGYSCDDLHAELVSRLGVWLDIQGVNWEWKNEYTGEIHIGYGGLIDFSTSRFLTSEWFRDIVGPLIKKERNG